MNIVINSFFFKSPGLADGDLQHAGTRAGQHDMWSQIGQQQQQQSQQQQQHHHSVNPFLTMRLPHGNLFPYSGGIAGHPAYATAHPAALAAHHAAAAAAWNNLKQNGSPSSVAAAVAAASAAAAGFQPRYWLHPHWPAAAHAGVFDPLALAAHPEAGSSPPQHPDYTSFMLQSHQQLQHHHHHHLQMGQNASHDSRSPASSPASSLPAGDSPTPELDNSSSSSHNSKSPSVVGDKTILDLRVKIAGAKGSPSLVSE
jgi:hypothetical protein